jgi:hypothetical protein
MEKVYEIGQTYIRLDFNADDDFKEAFEKYLLYKGKHYAKEYFKKDLLVDYLYFTVELEDGSLISRLKIFGKIAIGSLIAYGGIRQGIDYVIKDARTVTEHIVLDVSNEPNIGNNRIIRVERRLGVPGKIKRLYRDIDKLRSDRNNLSENEQQEIINRIQRNYEDLVLELDQLEIQAIHQDLTQNQIPLPFREHDDNFPYPPRDAIREKEIRLISEDRIQEPRELPPSRHE